MPRAGSLKESRSKQCACSPLPEKTLARCGGHVDNPTYEQVITETTGHREAVLVEYDPTITSYEKLLDTFFHFIDPIETRGQFCDFGESYTTAIYAGSEDELKLAQAGKDATAAKVLVEIGFVAGGHNCGASGSVYTVVPLPQ